MSDQKTEKQLEKEDLDRYNRRNTLKKMALDDHGEVDRFRRILSLSAKKIFDPESGCNIQNSGLITSRIEEFNTLMHRIILADHYIRLIKQAKAHADSLLKSNDLTLFVILLQNFMTFQENIEGGDLTDYDIKQVKDIIYSIELEEFVKVFQYDVLKMDLERVEEAISNLKFEEERREKITASELVYKESEVVSTSVEEVDENNKENADPQRA